MLALVLSTIVEQAPDTGASVLTPRVFRSRAEVATALSLFAAEQLGARAITVREKNQKTGSNRADVAWGEYAAAADAGAPEPELWPEFQGFDRRDKALGSAHADRVWGEGPRWRLSLAPGIIRVSSSDVGAAERAAERAVHAHRKDVDALAAALEGQDALSEAVLEQRKTHRVIRSWSRRSRSRMIQKLGSLDYAPLLEGGGVTAMVTLTYPGQWRHLAPDAATAYGHLRNLQKRFERAYGRPLCAVWKREFQRRGAPHFHLLLTVPQGRVQLDGRSVGFSVWLAETWVSIVAPPPIFALRDPDERAKMLRSHLHETTVDYNEGARVLDPVRLGIYFAKHGAFAAKEYQNEAPETWCHGADCEGGDCDGCQGVGRFWGFWHLEDATETIEVAPDVAQALYRAMRRHSRANRYYRRAQVVRKVTTVDRETGEIGWKWRRRTTRKPVYYGRGRAGFVMYNDAPAFAGQLARWADQSSRASVRRNCSGSGLGPVGFLP